MSHQMECVPVINQTSTLQAAARCGSADIQHLVPINGRTFHSMTHSLGMCTRWPRLRHAHSQPV